MKTCVIVPTYNEARGIARVIEQVRQQNIEVIVVDDGSSDDTCRIAQAKGATVLRNEINQGKGASLIRGFDYALKRGFEACITLDGDGQHDPADIPYFMRLAEYSASGIIIGNRMSKAKGMPLTRLLTNKFMSWLISSLIKQDIPDTQCGFRLIKREILQRVNLRTHKYEIESELIMKAAKLGFKIESVSIQTVYNDEKSRINPFLDTLRFIRFIMKEAWTSPF